MSWLYSRALVEEFLEGISLDGAQCALWNGTHTQPPSWCSVKTMAACRLSRSGMTFRPLTDDLGEAVLMSFREAFPAQTSPVLEKERESRESNPPCGSTWRELSMRCVREKGYSSRIVQCLLWAEDLEPSSVTLPKWGMMRNGELWERITLPPLTSATGSGLWATPCASETGEDPEKLVKRMKERYGREGSEVHMKLSTQVKMWPTPTANEDAAGTPEGQMQCMLTHAAKTGCLSREQYKQMKASRATDAGKTSSTGAVTTTGNGSAKIVETGPILSTTSSKTVASHAVPEMFPTPTSRDWKDGPGMSLEGKNPDGSIRKRDDLLPRRIFSQGHTGGQLNPDWVEWLMGWPIVWTGLNALGTDKSHNAQP